MGRHIILFLFIYFIQSAKKRLFFEISGDSDMFCLEFVSKKSMYSNLILQTYVSVWLEIQQKKVISYFVSHVLYFPITGLDMCKNTLSKCPSSLSH